MEQQLKQLNDIQNKITNIVELHRKNIDELCNWKQIKGYDNYSVSNRGEVRNDKTRKILIHLYTFP